MAGKFKKLSTLAGLLITLGLFFIFPAKAADEEVSYTPDGTKGCLECHDEHPTNQILLTPHAVSGDSRTPFADEGCESCHGPSADHVKRQAGQAVRALPAVVFRPDSPNSVEEKNQVCLDCHEGSMRINWTGSPHHSSDLSCVSCHAVHVQKDPILVKMAQDEVCYTCHVEQKAQSFRRSRHPIREGKIACSDCHNPHGSFGPKLLHEANVNDTCYNCHAEKRGPFLWEHAPVRDDCTTCHTPHGSSQPRLLKVRTPFLCQQCHIEAFHPSTLYSGDDIPPFGASERILAKGCLNCHPKVHGSNHPSGVRLTR